MGGPKQIDVTCPCCSTVLTVDVLTRQILRREEPPAPDAPDAAGAEGGEGGAAARREERWGAAQERVAGRAQSSQDKLDRALADERDKESRLDDLFRKAQEKLSRKDDESR